MQRTSLLLGIIIILTVTFLGFQMFAQFEYAEFVRFPIIPLLTYLYYLNTKDNSSYFFKFLAAFSLSELFGGFGLLYYFFEYDWIDNVQYYGANICSILAYGFLILDVSKNLNIKQILKRFPIHFFVLIALDLYCVFFVSKVSTSSFWFTLDDDRTSFVFYLDATLEILYNLSVMLLLTVTVINYLFNDSTKALLLLFGALFIVFTEVIQVAFYYIEDKPIFGILSSIFLIAAVTLFYIQSHRSYSETRDFKTVDKLEA